MLLDRPAFWKHLVTWSPDPPLVWPRRCSLAWVSPSPASASPSFLGTHRRLGHVRSRPELRLPAGVDCRAASVAPAATAPAATAPATAATATATAADPTAATATRVPATTAAAVGFPAAATCRPPNWVSIADVHPFDRWRLLPEHCFYPCSVRPQHRSRIPKVRQALRQDQLFIYRSGQSCRI
ncbi:uncharacterized protein BJ171DRAFT_268065 [Polychytrium aggregatum]|uniref:uncharacterized protein n=1 Tax=Polychytrium aggregatum TaxID=110093 RepID=UPI0022FF3F6A|nr:uncharacterized protein BJ171DRAFT_268065 [Polychytrium aggregatum]KAI9193368.1 hypothetical protein BJ171DRAFT_268065 [Polychytrium aggregatum]